MKISIIIPVYNVEPYVERCLRSVMNQSYSGDLECLIVDDCGTDNSMAIIEGLLSQYNGAIQFKVIKHPYNRGLSAARNTGIDNCSGDYVFFLDSDDELTIDCMEKLSLPLLEEQYDIIVGNVKTIGDDKLDELLRLKLSHNLILRGEDIQKSYRYKWNMIAPGKLYRLEFIRFQQLRFKEGMIHEDELWSLQVSCVAKSLKSINEVCYLYYIRSNSITTQDLNRKTKKAQMLHLIVVEMSNFLKSRQILSQSAYKLLLIFMTRSLKPYINNRRTFVEKFLQLHKDANFPLRYRICAAGKDVRIHLKNLLFLLPPVISANIFFLKLKFEKKKTNHM